MHLPLSTGWSSPDARISGFMFVGEALTDEELKALDPSGLPPKAAPGMTFSGWLGVEISVLRDKDGVRLGLSREMLIKRVANLLGASHPMGSEDSLDRENRFDPYIRQLHSFQLVGVRATYYQVMEIASDLIAALRPLFAPET
jgi:hypothetical protein